MSVTHCIQVRSISVLLAVFFFQYLDGMFERDPKSGGQYHERQVDLYAKFEPGKLLAFLRSCNDIPLQRVLWCTHVHIAIDSLQFVSID